MTSTNKLFRQHYVEMKGQLTPEQQEWYIEKFKELGIKEIGFWAGFSKVGKTSQAAMLREYYQKNKVKFLESNRRRRVEKKAEIAAYHKQWCKDNKEKLAAKRLAWQRANKDRLNAKRRMSAQADPEKLRKRSREYQIKNREKLNAAARRRYAKKKAERPCS